MTQVFTVLGPILEALMGKYGIAVQVVSVFGTLRVVFKPLMVFLSAMVAATPSKIDDSVLARIQASPAYSWLSFALDYVASLKLPQTK